MALTPNFPDIIAGLGINGFGGGNRARSAEVNSYVLEPLLYLKARPILYVRDTDGTVSNTTSSSFTDITGASGSIATINSGKLLIIGMGYFTGGPTSSTYFTFSIDGVDQGDATYGLWGGYQWHSQKAGLFTYVSAALSDGAHTVKLRYKADGVTLTCSNFTLFAMEVA